MNASGAATPRAARKKSAISPKAPSECGTAPPKSGRRARMTRPPSVAAPNSCMRWSPAVYPYPTTVSSNRRPLRVRGSLQCFVVHCGGEEDFTTSSPVRSSRSTPRPRSLDVMADPVFVELTQTIPDSALGLPADHARAKTLMICCFIFPLRKHRYLTSPDENARMHEDRRWNLPVPATDNVMWSSIPSGRAISTIRFVISISAREGGRIASGMIVHQPTPRTIGLISRDFRVRRR
jgi:hypothetical protein